MQTSHNITLNLLRTLPIQTHTVTYKPVSVTYKNKGLSRGSVSLRE